MWSPTPWPTSCLTLWMTHLCPRKGNAQRPQTKPTIHYFTNVGLKVLTYPTTPYPLANPVTIPMSAQTCKTRAILHSCDVFLFIKKLTEDSVCRVQPYSLEHWLCQLSRRRRAEFCCCCSRVYIQLISRFSRIYNLHFHSANIQAKPSKIGNQPYVWDSKIIILYSFRCDSFF